MTVKKDIESTRDSIIKNEDTLVRRAWIDSALHSVRSQLTVSALATSSADESMGRNLLAEAAPEPAEAQQPERPKLVLAYSNGRKTA